MLRYGQGAWRLGAFVNFSHMMVTLDPEIDLLLHAPFNAGIALQWKLNLLN
jgi:hypothetical protein